MVDSTKDSSTDKFALIYEFNNNSPLFARVAFSEMQKGQFESALKILESGLENYPDYPTALIIYAILNAEIGKLSKAKQVLSKAAELYNDDESFDFYVKHVEEIVSNNARFSEIRGSSFVSESLQNHEDLMEDENESYRSVETQIPSQTHVSNKIDDNLEELAEVISKVKIKSDPTLFSENKDISDDENHEDEIVSETMASIYRAQEKYKEAIGIYRKLISRNPSKKEHYETKIAEIEKLIAEND
ncbi:MAG: tetratricopeptide repeat protein [Melioribacteraceae bacterium]|nr:tetratricopeptide repeat protein [Melioribacteraceae bacterium]MCF8263245.1 tetratricopeptide repeat protein [Melioribacteraceae bacterium]MCF8432308.1 tetratricopeptide repeat protein [Melioribacteraceae bacterium]